MPADGTGEFIEVGGPTLSKEGYSKFSDYAARETKKVLGRAGEVALFRLARSLGVAVVLIRGLISTVG